MPIHSTKVINQLLQLLVCNKFLTRICEGLNLKRFANIYAVLIYTHLGLQIFVLNIIHFFQKMYIIANIEGWNFINTKRDVWMFAIIGRQRSYIFCLIVLHLLLAQYVQFHILRISLWCNFQRIIIVHFSVHGFDVSRRWYRRLRVSINAVVRLTNPSWCTTIRSGCVNLPDCFRLVAIRMKWNQIWCTCADVY